MSAYDWFAIGATAGLIALVAWYSRGPADDQAAWEASTAALIEDEARELRRVFGEIVADQFPETTHDIPHQARRTEEDQ